MAEPPDALFASQNLVTLGCIRALHRLGLHHQVPLVGFDEVELAEALDPGITVVAQDLASIGKKAADLLFGRIDGDRGPPATYVVPTTLVKRGSGEIRLPSSAARGG